MSIDTNSAADNIVKWPFGPASKIAVVAGATMAATIKNSKTHITISEMGAAGTLNLTLSDQLEAGATLKVKASADGTNRVLTLGTGLTGNAITVTASKSFEINFEFDGSTFVCLSSLVQN